MQSILITLGLSLPAILILSALYRRSIYHRLRSNADDLVFNRATTSLHTTDIILVILLLIVEDVKRILGLHAPEAGSHQKRSAGYGNPSVGSGVKELPRISISMNLDITPTIVSQYYTALGIPVNLQHPISSTIITDNNCHLALFLAAITNPALLLLLARPKCPISPLGGVNVKNYFKIMRPDLCRQLISQDWSKHDGKENITQGYRLAVRASPNPVGRRVNRGTEFDIRVVIIMHEAHSRGEEIEVFEQIFTVLEFGKKSSKAPSKQLNNSSSSSILTGVSKKDLKVAPMLASYFTIQSSDPIQWARLCRDYNPIHISSLAAKVFGFRSKIAHGNHAVARGVYMLSKSGHEAFEQFCNQRDDQQLWMSVEFKRPILLPAEVGVRSTEDISAPSKSDRQAAGFEIFKGDKVHIEAAVGSSYS